jgi:hypothetical protein
MKRKVLSLVVLFAFSLVAGGGCRSRTDRSAGTVVLTFGDITGIPTIVSVGQTLGSGGAGQVTITTFILQSVSKDPTGTTGPLQDIEVSSYQVIYKRRDTGTRVPPPLVAGLTLEVPVDSTGTIGNLPIVRLDQLLNPPLSDLSRFGVDQETGTAIIVLDAQITFFGRTLSGDQIASAPANFTIEFTP